MEKVFKLLVAFAVWKLMTIFIFFWQMTILLDINIHFKCIQMFPKDGVQMFMMFEEYRNVKWRVVICIQNKNVSSVALFINFILN